MRDVITKNRRLAILRFLADEPEYSMNANVLQSGLRAIGHAVSRDRIDTDCAWLEEQGLITVKKLDVPLTVFQITRRGIEVAEGIATHPGVDRPLPGK